jgi:L-cysteine/cystine lyase
MFELRARARAGIARALAAPPEQVALTSSTSHGIGLVCAGLDWRQGDDVITTTEEHPGLLGPLDELSRRHGVVLRAVPAAEVTAAVGPRTRLVAVSHVLWTTGRRLDLHRVRRESGLPVLVDGAQSAGAIPVEVGDLDYYTVSAQKWLCAPEPTGALYVRDRDALRVVAPSYASQVSYEISGAFVPKEGAARFDTGWIGIPTLAGLLCALRTHPEWRYERAAENAARCAELLAEHVDVVTPPGHSTLVSFRPAGDPAELVASLFDRGVIIRELPGRNLLRASCGWWTNEDDLQRLVAGITAVSKNGA